MSDLRLSVGGVFFRHHSCVSGHGPGTRAMTKSVCRDCWVDSKFHRTSPSVRTTIKCLVEMRREDGAEPLSSPHGRKQVKSGTFLDNVLGIMRIGCHVLLSVDHRMP